MKTIEISPNNRTGDDDPVPAALEKALGAFMVSYAEEGEQEGVRRRETNEQARIRCYRRGKGRDDYAHTEERQIRTERLEISTYLFEAVLLIFLIIL